MVYKIGEIKYTSIYRVVLQPCTKKGIHYVHRAIFYLNKYKENNMKLYQKNVQPAYVS
jgi:hypothetical protein